MPILDRACFHKADDEINLMELKLARGQCGPPHFNDGRDEIIVVLEGEIEISIGADDPLRLDCFSRWISVKAGVVHQITCVTETAKILEVIVGKHFEGACVVIDV